MPFRLTRQMTGALQPHYALALLQAPCALALTALRSGKDILEVCVPLIGLAHWVVSPPIGLACSAVSSPIGLAYCIVSCCCCPLLHMVCVWTVQPLQCVFSVVLFVDTDAQAKCLSLRHIDSGPMSSASKVACVLSGTPNTV